ncbi:Uncharacterised protein [Staphylococcus xylosus]|nr:Uncharacterised protein [Staphylococcus xylosus]
MSLQLYVEARKNTLWLIINNNFYAAVYLNLVDCCFFSIVMFATD